VVTAAAWSLAGDGIDGRRQERKTEHNAPIRARHFGDYASFANFSDPDGNSWVLQERGYRNV
jgi:hypothetical protein